MFLKVQLFIMLRNLKKKLFSKLKKIIWKIFFKFYLKIKPIKESSKHLILNGKYSYGIYNITIHEWGEGAKLHVGSFCSIAENLTIILGGNHRTDWTTTFPFGTIFNEEFPLGRINGHGHPKPAGDVIIENDVWIGRDCTIMSGIRLGSGSVLAAKSVVVKDVEPYTIVGGNPAKVIRRRFPLPIIERLLEIKWWDREDLEINKIVPLLQMPPNEQILNRVEEILNINN